MKIRMRAILPGPFDTRTFDREMRREMEKLVKEIKADFEKTVATWDHKPTFVTSIRVSFDELRGRVRTRPISGRKPPELIYYFLSEGTRVRHAIMSNDFVPKSRVRTIDSFPGQGGLLRVDPRFHGPGIKARKWDEAIADKNRAKVPFRLAVALRRGARNSGHHHT